MKKLYVCGWVGDANAIEKIRKTLQLNDDVDIIQVNSLDEMPFEYRLKHDLLIQQVHEIKAPPILPEINYSDAKIKGNHKRPYKYHK